MAAKTERQEPEITVTAKTNPDLEPVKVTFPKIRGTKDQDIVIIVNGKAWQIQRGIQVEVPRYVLEVYDNSERSRDEAENYIVEQTVQE